MLVVVGTRMAGQLVGGENVYSGLVEVPIIRLLSALTLTRASE